MDVFSPLPPLDGGLYPAMFTRRSTRRWKDGPPSPALLEEINGVLNTLVPLLDGQPFRWTTAYAGGGVTRLYAFGDLSPLGRVNIGFLLQQVDLWMQRRRLGCLWFGMGQEPESGVPEEFRPLRYAVQLRFGRADGAVSRADASEFHRGPIEKTVDDPALFSLMEPVRLAPSAVNSQPWFFHREGNLLRVYKRRLDPVRARLYGRTMNYYDIGIAVCHAVLSLQHEGRRPAARVEPDAPALPGHDYIVSLTV